MGHMYKLQYLIQRLWAFYSYIYRHNSGTWRMTLCIAKGQNYWAWPKLFCLQLFLHIISSNKTFSWEYSSITAHWQSASPSSLKPLTPSIPCFKQSSHRTLASHPPTGPTVAFPFLSALDLAEPGVLLLPGMFLLRSTALLISPSDRGPTIPSKGAPPPLLLDLFLFIYLQILLLYLKYL